MFIDSRVPRFLAACVATVGLSLPILAQVTPAAASTPPDDTPKVNIGTTIFADYTYAESPEGKDSDGNTIHNSAFNITRAYINVTGNLNHWLAFRVTPDVTRETGTGSSLNGSLTFRLKYAFAQLNLDDWTTKGSWVRLGLQQTPYLDYSEGIYRYRFQGTMFPERAGLISSSDAGISGHYNFAGNYGDVHAGFYNGENYNRTEVNNEKAFDLRATVRPAPLGGPWLKGLRLTGFVIADHYVEDGKRQRAIGQVTYEHARFNAGFDYVRASDQPTAAHAATKSKGWGVWVTPKLGPTGWEALLRHDNFVPNDAVNSQKQKRDIDGIAYWFPHTNGKTLAVLVDRDSLKRTGLTPAAPNTTNYEVKMLVNF